MPGPVSITRMTVSPSSQSSTNSTRPPSGGELHCVVDQIDNGLEQKIAVALHRRPIGSFGPKGDTLVLGDRTVEIAHFANQRGELDLAKPFSPSAMLDFRNAQQRRDRGQQLVETSDRLIGKISIANTI
jgi:hypothetical protein